jgi:hypothetical protein
LVIAELPSGPRELPNFVDTESWRISSLLRVGQSRGDRQRRLHGAAAAARRAASTVEEALILVGAMLGLVMFPLGRAYVQLVRAIRRRRSPERYRISSGRPSHEHISRALKDHLQRPIGLSYASYCVIEEVRGGYGVAERWDLLLHQPEGRERLLQDAGYRAGLSVEDGRLLDCFGSRTYLPMIAHAFVASEDARCIYCRHGMDRYDLDHLIDRVRPGDTPVGSTTDGRVCPSCGWWLLLSYFNNNDIIDPGWSAAACGVLWQSSGDAATESSLVQLRSFLSRRPDHVAHTNSTAFELLIRDCLRDRYPDAVVEHVGGTGDGGVDIVFARLGETSTVVQVKRRQRLDKPEGVSVVRELHGVMFRDDLTRGMVVSTAPRYTAGAHEEVQRAAATTERYQMDLLAMADVEELLNLRPAVGPAGWSTLRLPGDLDAGTRVEWDDHQLVNLFLETDPSLARAPMIDWMI